MGEPKATSDALPTTARVVIIGGGIVGVSTLYHLAKAGWRDCLLLEKNELTAGSTWHAAGNCPNFSASASIVRLQRTGLELYRRLGDEVDYPINYHVSGSLRLAHGGERMREFAHVAAMAEAQGLEMRLLSPSEMRDKHPFMEIHDLAGGLWDPLDGDIDPAQITQALAVGARRLGAQIRRFQPATGVTQSPTGEWIVHTDAGDVRAEVVVNAAGYYAREVGAWFQPYGGRIPPMTTLEHQYMLTEEIPELAAWAAENGGKLPLIRDPDISYYLRQEKGGLNLGPYERNCRTAWTAPGDRTPDDFSFQLFPDDLDRLAFYIEDAMERVPALGRAGVSRVINGPIPYAPDGHPLVGPSPGLRNVFEACCFTFGIAQGGGAGVVAAEWITQGRTEADMWAVDPRRFLDHADQTYCDATGAQVYGHEYAMHFPMHAWPAGRPARTGPNDAAVRAAGGVMDAYGGWERAMWFAAPGDDVSEEAAQTWDRDGPWSPRIDAECAAVRDAVGVLDLPGFSRFNLRGAGAADWLSTRMASGLPRAGRVGLAYFADDRGRLLTEMSVLRHDEDFFTLITAASARRHDFDLLNQALPRDGALELTDHTDAFTTLVVTGPASRDVLAPLVDADLSAPWLSHQPARALGRSAALARVSFAGELGWEIHCALDDAPPIYAALREAGAAPFGMAALDSLRIEKGYRGWKTDLSSDYTLLELGLDRFLKLDKPHAFPGKEALRAEAARGPDRRLTSLRLDSPQCDAPYMAPIRDTAGAIVGAVTACAKGRRVGAVVALGVVDVAQTGDGTALTVDVHGERRPATVQPQLCLWDPNNERLRA